MSHVSHIPSQGQERSWTNPALCDRLEVQDSVQLEPGLMLCENLSTMGAGLLKMVITAGRMGFVQWQVMSLGWVSAGCLLVLLLDNLYLNLS